jgi:prefoldin subunit 5
MRFQQKIPEIEKSLSLVRYLKTQKEEEAEVITRYSLAETIFATAQVECNGTVHLWLGANVMLEYTYDEAIELLSSKETIAKKEHQNVSNFAHQLQKHFSQKKVFLLQKFFLYFCF